MNMDTIYYVILIVTVVSYLLGLFLSHFEKKKNVSFISDMGNAGFINIFGGNSPDPISEQLQAQLIQQQQQEISFHQSAQMGEHPFQPQAVMKLQQQSQSIPEYHQVEQLEDVNQIEVLDFEDEEIL